MQSNCEGILYIMPENTYGVAFYSIYARKYCKKRMDKGFQKTKHKQNSQGGKQKMKNIFTKAIVCAGVVASAMALSSIAVFAADTLSSTVPTDADQTSGSVKITKSGDSVTYTYDINSGVPTTLASGQNITIENGVLTKANNEATGNKTKSFYGINAELQKADNTWKFSSDAKEVSFEIPAGDEATLKLVNLVDSVKVKSGGSEVTAENGIFNLTAGKCVITRSSSKTRIDGLTVVVTPSTDPVLTISDSALSITQGEEATVTANLINSTDEIKAVSDNTKVTAAVSGNTITISAAKDAAADSTATITISAGSLSKTVTVTVKEAKTIVSVEPTVSGDTKTYTFTGLAGKRLIYSDDESKSATTAYAMKESDVSVDFTSAGATLIDDNGSKASTLVVPVNVSSGKLTVSGSVTPTNAVGSKWALVNIGGLYIGSDSASNITLTTDNSSAATTHCGKVAKDSTVTYNVVLDLDNKTASGTVTNGSTTKEFTNVALSSEKVASINFVTNGGGAGSSARTLVIPSVTYTVEAAEATLTEGTFEAAGGKVVVKGTTAYLVGEFTTLDANGQLSVGNNNVFTTDTVYKSVVDGNDTIAAEKDGTYYYAVKVTDLTSDEEVAHLKRFTVA